MEHENELKLINMSDVKVTEVKWLWKPYIPIGKIAIIQGDPGEGKTTMILAILNRAEQMIKEMLGDGAKSSEYVEEKAKEKQISQRTLKTAKKNFEVKFIKTKEGCKWQL